MENGLLHRRMSEQLVRELLHLLGLAAMTVDKALLYERSREQARHEHPGALPAAA